MRSIEVISVRSGIIGLTKYDVSLNRLRGCGAPDTLDNLRIIRSDRNLRCGAMIVIKECRLKELCPTGPSKLSGNIRNHIFVANFFT